MANTAFIGMGLMGAPMAGHLLKAGHKVAVWNRTRSKAEALGKQGARVAEVAVEVDLREDQREILEVLPDDRRLPSRHAPLV